MDDTFETILDMVDERLNELDSKLRMDVLSDEATLITLAQQAELQRLRGQIVGLNNS